MLWGTVVATVAVGIVTIINNWALAVYNNRQHAKRDRTGVETKIERSRRSSKRLSYAPDFLMLVSSLFGLAQLILHPKVDVNSQIIWVALFVGALGFSAIAFVTTYVLNLFEKQLEALWVQAEFNKLARERLQDHERQIGKIATILERDIGAIPKCEADGSTDDDG